MHKVLIYDYVELFDLAYLCVLIDMDKSPSWIILQCKMNIMSILSHICNDYMQVILHHVSYIIIKSNR